MSDPHALATNNMGAELLQQIDRGVVKVNATKSGGMRLSAAAYFYDMCDGKSSRCTPQPIVQPNGKVKLNTIRVVNGAHGLQVFLRLRVEETGVRPAR